MIATCNTCSSMFETTYEDACTPGVQCAPCYLKSQLLETGATLEKREDRQGDTRTGWWLDGVFLGESVREALAAIRG